MDFANEGQDAVEVRVPSHGADGRDGSSCKRRAGVHEGLCTHGTRLEYRWNARIYCTYLERRRARVGWISWMWSSGWQKLKLRFMISCVSMLRLIRRTVVKVWCPVLMIMTPWLRAELSARSDISRSPVTTIAAATRLRTSTLPACWSPSIMGPSAVATARKAV